MLKTLYKSSCSYTGTEVTDEALHFYDRYSPNYKYNGPDISDLTYEQRIEYNTRRNNDLSIEKSQQECYRMNGILMNQQYNSLDLLLHNFLIFISDYINDITHKAIRFNSIYNFYSIYAVSS